MRNSVWSKEFVFPLFRFSLELSVTVRKDRQPFSLVIPPYTSLPPPPTVDANFWKLAFQLSYAFFKRNFKSPHRATSSWQPTGSGIWPKRLQLFASCAKQAELGGLSNKCTNGSFSYTCQEAELWGEGAEAGAKHGIENKRIVSSFTIIPIPREWALCIESSKQNFKKHSYVHGCQRVLCA